MPGRFVLGKSGANVAQAASTPFDADVRAPEHGTGAPPRRQLADRMVRALKGPPSAERAHFQFSDSLRALYAPAPPAAAEPTHYSLGFSLTQSAVKIREAQRALLERGALLASAIEDRRNGEQQMAINAVRVLIALIWAVYAFALDRSALATRAQGAAFVDAAMPVADAQVISVLLVQLAIAGFVGAMIGGLLTRYGGGGSNTRLRSVASALGAEAAAIAKDFDRALDERRALMDKRGARASDAVEDLSRMHMTALESAAFFHDVQFLTDSDRSTASKRFRAYLARAAAEFSGESASARFLAGLILVILGAIVGLGLGHHLFSPSAPPSTDLATSLAKYPGPFFAVAGLGFIYAIVGIGLSLFRGPITVDAAVQARDEALDSVRAAFVTGNAPRVEAIIRRIEDALDVYKARLSTGAASAAHQAAEADEPAWRRVPEGPRFLAQSFHASPGAFSAKPQPAPKQGFFSSRSDERAAPKQSLEGREKGGGMPPWLNE